MERWIREQIKYAFMLLAFIGAWTAIAYVGLTFIEFLERAVF